jgi:predicted amino acid racemase
MTTPYLAIDLDKIEHNARVVTALCRDNGLRVTGVTKCVCGHPAVARAMLRGGVHDIGDSRLENIRRMREAGVEATFNLIRLPPLSAADRVVELVDLSLNSEPATLAALAREAAAGGRVHDVVIMVDLGDLREGVWPTELQAVVDEASRLPGLRIRGLGSNLGCFGGVLPDPDNMGRLVSLAEQVEAASGIKFELLSGVNSGGLEMLEARTLPARINHARIGEAILLGRETTRRRPWPGTHQDVFMLFAEVLELRDKPSRPLGQRGEDAFGGQPDFEDRGTMPRALLNLGREDVDVSGLTPLDDRLRILGASSGYLVVDVSAAPGAFAVGDEIGFAVNYSALLAAMTSEYVKKRPATASEPQSLTETSRA